MEEDSMRLGLSLTLINPIINQSTLLIDNYIVMHYNILTCGIYIAMCIVLQDIKSLSKHTNANSYLLTRELNWSEIIIPWARHLTSSSTVAGPLDLRRRVPLPVPNCAEPDLLPDRWLIMSKNKKTSKSSYQIDCGHQCQLQCVQKLLPNAFIGSTSFRTKVFPLGSSFSILATS